MSRSFCRTSSSVSPPNPLPLLFFLTYRPLLQTDSSANWCSVAENSDKMEALYTRLELSQAEGKRLTRSLKDYVRTSPFAILLRENSNASTKEGKESLGKTALHILKSEGWGEKWFGRHCTTAATRKQFWPADSTLVTINFSALLHKALRIEKQVLQSRAKKAADKWEHESVTSLTSRASSTESASNAASRDGPILLDLLVRNVTNSKLRAEQGFPEERPICDEVPDNADLTYRVYVKDKITGCDLSAPTVYSHANQCIARGAYEYLKSSFEAAGYSPIVTIHTANSTRNIGSEEDWVSAVREIYWWRSRGGVVEVDMLV